MKNFNQNGLIVTSNYCDIHKGPVLRFIDMKWTDFTTTTMEQVKEIEKK